MYIIRKMERYVARQGQTTSKAVAKRFNVSIEYAAANLCNLAKQRRIKKSRKVRGAGVRWYWIWRA